MSFTLDTFWIDYTDLNNNNCPFDGDNFIWISKNIHDGNCHLWYQKYSIPCTEVLGFLACIVTLKYWYWCC